MPQQQNCSDTVAFDSWRLCSVALKMCYRHTPKLCCFSVTFSALSSFLYVTELQSNNSVNCQGEFFDTLEGNSSSSSKCLELWFQIFPLEKFWPLFGIKFQYFMTHGILLFPSNLLACPGEIAKSGDSESVWKIFTLRQRDSLMAWSKRS